MIVLSGFVSAVDDLEEQVGRRSAEGDVAYLVNDQELGLDRQITRRTLRRWKEALITVQPETV